MCFGCCDDANTSSHWQSTNSNPGFVQDRPIYDYGNQPSYGGGLDTTISSQPSYGGGWGGGFGGGLETTIHSQPSYGGGGLETTIESQPSYGGGYGGGGMSEEITSSPSRY